jgi:hypothetical protein
MTVDCQWIHKNLEALFCGTLSPEDNRMARAHIESCSACEREVAALNAIDPLVKGYFQNQVNLAIHASAARQRTLRGRRIAVCSAAVLAASVLLGVVLHSPHRSQATQSTPIAQEVVGSQIPESAPQVKTDDTTDVERAKPVESAPLDRAQPAGARPAIDNKPEFLVTDPAGYSRTLADYRGHILVVGLLNSRQPDSTSNLERLYKTFNSNPKIRFLAIADDRRAKPANTTFPIAYNQGSRLFDARPGDFVLLDEAGKIRLRGSLAKDIESLRKTLQGDLGTHP